MANNNSNEVISKAGNAVMATRGVKIAGGLDPTGPQINPSNKMVKVHKVLDPVIFSFSFWILVLRLWLKRRVLCPVRGIDTVFHQSFFFISTHKYVRGYQESCP